MKIDCVSDTHGKYPKMEGGDLLIHAGDWTRLDTEPEVFAFFDWLDEQPYTHKVIIAGNHDNLAQKETYKGPVGNQFHYLCDSGVEIAYRKNDSDTLDPNGVNPPPQKRFETLKIWGSPWTQKFYGQNPKCMAFALDTETQMMEKWVQIPTETDLLITHSPPYGVMDNCWSFKRCGCKHLHRTVCRIAPRYHTFGHIHRSYHAVKTHECDGITYINASYVDEDYRPVNKPIRIEI